MLSHAITLFEEVLAKVDKDSVSLREREQVLDLIERCRFYLDREQSAVWTILTFSDLLREYRDRAPSNSEVFSFHVLLHGVMQTWNSTQVPAPALRLATLPITEMHLN